LTFLASAPAKVILFGEHFVVENEPAIAAALDLRVEVSVNLLDEKRFEIRSGNLFSFVRLDDLLSNHYSVNQHFKPLYVILRKVIEEYGFEGGLKFIIKSPIPMGVGLGSSAAVFVAFSAGLLKAVAGEYDLEKVVKLASEGEILAHGRPSGIDPTISANGGVIVYRKSEGFIPLKAAVPLHLVIGVSGEVRSTATMVEKVLSLKKRFPEIFEPLYHAAGHLAIEAAKAIERGDLTSIGMLMNINHGLLSSLGVSTMNLERLVHAARDAGALGAKITGAGGGGAIISICPQNLLETVASAIKRSGGFPLISKVSDRGVSVIER